MRRRLCVLAVASIFQASEVRVPALATSGMDGHGLRFKSKEWEKDVVRKVVDHLEARTSARGSFLRVAFGTERRALPCTTFGLI